MTKKQENGYDVRLVQDVGNEVHVVWDSGTIFATDAAEAKHQAEEKQINQAITGDLLEDAGPPRWEVKFLGPF